MSPERRNFLLVIAAAVVVVAALLLWPEVEERLAPEPVTAWVAVEADGSGEAVVGAVEMEAGTSFRLHAVLEARKRDGSPLYYTEAPSLRLPSGPVPAEALKLWDREQEVRVLWFTVEGSVPYLELDPGGTLERFRMTEFLRPDWPQAWSVPGRLEPAHDDSLARERARSSHPFGTQRFHVRIELFGRGSRLVPEERYASWAAPEVQERGRDFPAAIASLPGPLGPLSSLFGLTQVQPPPEPPPGMVSGIRRLTDARLAFSRLTALRSHLEAAGERIGDLEWQLVSLDGEVTWGEGGAAPGDLVQVGDRWVILYRDQGRPGLLDREDLAFDFVDGAVVRPLGEVFVGGGEVELARL